MIYKDMPLTRKQKLNQHTTLIHILRFKLHNLFKLPVVITVNFEKALQSPVSIYFIQSQ